MSDRTALLRAYEATGAPTEIYHGEYKGRLVDLQPLNDGYVCGIYRFPGGDCTEGPMRLYSEIKKHIRRCE